MAESFLITSENCGILRVPNGNDRGPKGNIRVFGGNHYYSKENRTVSIEKRRSTEGYRGVPKRNRRVSKYFLIEESSEEIISFSKAN